MTRRLNQQNAEPQVPLGRQGSGHGGDPLWSQRVRRGHRDTWCAQHKGRRHRLSPTVTSSSQTSNPERQKYVNNHSFINAFREHGNICFFRGLFVLFNLFSKSIFWHNGCTNVSSDSQWKVFLYCIYSIYLCCGLCRALLLDNTRDTELWGGPNVWRVHF